MPRGPPPTDRPAPTKLAALPELLAYAQSLGVDRHRWRAKRGVSARALALLWLVLAWRGSGRPDPLDQRDAPLRAALLGLARLPCARPLRRSLPRLPAKRVRAAVAAAYLPELPRRAGRVEQAIEERLNGHDLDHLVSYRRPPNHAAIGLRLLARTLAIGQQIKPADARPAAVLREPRAFRVAAVAALGTFGLDQHAILITARRPTTAPPWPLPWAGLTVRSAPSPCTGRSTLGRSTHPCARDCRPSALCSSRHRCWPPAAGGRRRPSRAPRPPLKRAARPRSWSRRSSGRP